MGALHYEGAISGWIGFCIGAALLLLATAPLVYVILRWG